MTALLTDLYELTMAAGYFQAAKTAQIATFELTIRRLPPHRNFVIAAGLRQVVDYLLNLQFTEEDIAYLQSLKQFEHAPAEFFEYLRTFRFTGDLFAVPEGTPLFAGEPMLAVRAPIIEAQIPETYLLSAVSYPTLVASKAWRCMEAAQGRPVADFGTRRAHTPEAGVLAARAAWIGGCSATSNTLAGMRYGIPVSGTSAHSWVMSFACEIGAFRRLQNTLGESTVHLLDTYDTLEGARHAVQLGGPMWGVRIDSGNLGELSKQVRAILDDAGRQDAKIMASGDLDEFRIRELLGAGAPIDAFGVGTQLSTVYDGPSLSAVYKIVELNIDGIKRFTAKFSEDKISIPGAKQLFRDEDRDVIARSGECGRGEALMRPVLINGQLIEPLPSLQESRARAAESVSKLPAAIRSLDPAEPWPVIYSKELRELIERTQRNLRPQLDQ
jgi:nicotinate phosphoribosyltransferase